MQSRLARTEKEKTPTTYDVINNYTYYNGVSLTNDDLETIKQTINHYVVRYDKQVPFYVIYKGVQLFVSQKQDEMLEFKDYLKLIKLIDHEVLTYLEEHENLTESSGTDSDYPTQLTDTDSDQK